MVGLSSLPKCGARSGNAGGSDNDKASKKHRVADGEVRSSVFDLLHVHVFLVCPLTWTV